jgi:hypothetical protein
MTWACHTGTIFEDELTIKAGGWFDDEPPRTITVEGFHNVDQMVLDLTFRNLNHRRQLTRSHHSTDQQVKDSLARRTIVCTHRRSPYEIYLPEAKQTSRS